MLSIQILIIFMIAAALIAIEAKDFFASVLALGVLGLEMALAFLLLKAPDIAAVFLVMEVIGLGVLAKVMSGQKHPPAVKLDVFSTLTFTAFAALFLLVAARALIELPAFGSPLMDLGGLYAVQSLEKTGAANSAAAVAFVFRGLDALTAFFVMILTAFGIYHLTGRDE